MVITVPFVFVVVGVVVIVVVAMVVVAGACDHGDGIDSNSVGKGA